jgi:hypothetical protein
MGQEGQEQGELKKGFSSGCLCKEQKYALVSLILEVEIEA